MSHQIKINADLIENILLCDPVTFRGKEKLKALGLEEKIGPKEFFDPQNGLWVEPIDEAKTTDMFTFDSLDPSPYGAKKVKYDDIEDRRTEFNRRLSGTPGSYFIALMGVVGSGKSIEIQRRIFENYGEKFLPYRHDEYDGRNNILPATPDAILVDLERNVKHVTYSSTYTCPNADSPLWLFCTALLDTLFYYICFLHREHRAKLMHIENNLTYYFIREDKYTVKVDAHVADLFSAISKWARGHSEASLQDIFDKILSLLISKPTDYTLNRKTQREAAKRDIETLMRLLYLVSFCVEPKHPKVFVIDNLEDYIAVDFVEVEMASKRREFTRSVAVSNMEVKDIYDCLRSAEDIYRGYIEAVKTVTEYAEKPSVSVVMVARRTTVDLLDATYLNAYNARIDGIFDITGDTEIADIWARKKSVLWDNDGILKQTASPEEEALVEAFINFADKMICETNGGSSIQRKMSRILARGLRRIGHNESAIIYQMYELLMGEPKGIVDDETNKIKYIDMSKFLTIERKDAAQYLLRQAFIEYYFKQQLSKTRYSQNDVGVRWRNLNLGHLMPDDKTGTYYGRNRKPLLTGPTWEYSKVVYADADSIQHPAWRSLLHRVLAILDKYQRQDTDKSGCVAVSFKPISLYELMEKLFGSRDYKPSIDEFGRLAEVLLAASSPERHGDFAPMVLMRIVPRTDKEFYSDRGSFQATLQKIWNAGWTKSVDGEEYEWRCFGVRLGEAGKAFLIEWQPSFSFFAALYCNNQPPLFFVKNKEMIISILNKVCDYGRKVMYAYRREASAYLKKREPEKINHDEFTDKNQLAEKEESSQTYRQQIRDAHKRYLFLYKDYIDKCGSDLGLLDTEKTDIIHEIDSLINSYDALEWKEKAEIERIENENDREEAMRNLWPCF